MCQLCNETLEASASAAHKLALAAQVLYSINMSRESAILGEAAADLFRKPAEEAKHDPAKPNAGSGEATSAEESDLERARRVLNESLPEGVAIREDGALVLNGKAIGLAMLVRR